MHVCGPVSSRLAEGGRGGVGGGELAAGYWGFCGVGRAASVPWAIKHECFGDISEAGLGEGRRGGADRGVYGLGELEGGCAGCLGSDGASGTLDGCAECVAQCSGTGHDYEVEGRGYVRCEAGCDSGVCVGSLRRARGVLYRLSGDG